MNESVFVVSSFYKFQNFPDFEEKIEPLRSFCVKNNLKGTILVAKEGMNASMSGIRSDIDKLYIHLKDELGFEISNMKENFCDFQPFHKMKVRSRNEIVTIKDEGLSVDEVGEYLNPQKWNELIKQTDIMLIDTRNNYEVHCGTFEGAINPDINTFREFPEWFDKNAPKDKEAKIAMFCTGGIRCEKSTAYAKQKGYKNVYHLENGIVSYMEEVRNGSLKEDLWHGNCFVFDNREQINKDLEPVEWKERMNYETRV